MNAKSPKIAAKAAKKPALPATARNSARAGTKSRSRRVAGQQKTTPERRAATARPASKAAAVLAALQRERGATIEELMAATGWQAHSVRGFLSGTVRKKLALEVLSEATAQGRRYRVVSGAAAAR